MDNIFIVIINRPPTPAELKRAETNNQMILNVYEFEKLMEFGWDAEGGGVGLDAFIDKNNLWQSNHWSLAICDHTRKTPEQYAKWWIEELNKPLKFHPEIVDNKRKGDETP